MSKANDRVTRTTIGLVIDVVLISLLLILNILTPFLTFPTA